MANDIKAKTNGSLALFGDDAKGFDMRSIDVDKICIVFM